MTIKRIIPLLFLAALKAGAQTSALSISDSLYTVGNYSEAISTLQEISPATEAVDLRLARAYQAKGEHKEAKRYYEKLLLKNEEKVLPLLEYAGLLEKTGELKKADSVLTGLIRRYPKNSSFHYRLGLVKEKNKDSSALNSYYITVLLSPSHQQALFKIAKNALRNAKFPTSEKYALQGLEHHPASPGFLSLLAQTYYHQARYELAARNFSSLLELGEESEFIYSSLGKSLYHLRNYDKAIEAFLEALRYEQNEAENHFSLGKLYALTGELDKSEEHLLKSILLKTPILDSEYLSLALTYKEKKDYKNTLKYLDRALEENPDNERALFERAIAADNYYEDLQTKIDFYGEYLEKFRAGGQQAMIGFAEHRQRELREKLHLSQGK